MHPGGAGSGERVWISPSPAEPRCDPRGAAMAVLAGGARHPPAVRGAHGAEEEMADPPAPLAARCR